MPIPSFPYLIATPSPVVEVDVATSPLDRPVGLASASHLGFGLLRPFRRDEKNDFANAGGEALVRACVGQVLGTRCSSETTQGELEWNPEFGSLLYLLRHRKNDVGLQEIGRHYIVDSLRRWEPRARVKATSITRQVTEGLGENQLIVRLRYDIISADTPGNDVLIPDVTQTVVV
jgi:hypothetical protein